LPHILKVIGRNGLLGSEGKLFFPAINEDELTNEEHIETAVDLFLEGLRPER
jgi:hypothetical protein